MRVICVCTGEKYTDWHVQNLKNMLDKYSGLEYNEYVVLTKDKYNGVFNKLLMFDEFRDGENLYFDLDLVIYNKIPNLIRQNVTVLHAWWREAEHTPYNSSIISWKGDQSHIYKTFLKQEDYYLTKYNRGIDEFLYKEIGVDTYEPVCYSIQDKEYDKKDENYSICLFNQRQHLMEEGWSGWWNDYFIEKAT